MFIPVTDQNPLRRISRPYVVWGLIAVNCLVFALQLLLAPDNPMDVLLAGGLTPVHLLGTDGAILPQSTLLPPAVTLITYMFLHANLWHLVANMVFLHVFGDNVEDAVGHVRILPFYLLCGVAGGLTHAVVSSDSLAPLIGASGATAGLVGAYLLLHPRVNIWVLVLGRIPLRLPAYWVIAAWLVWQVFSILAAENQTVAWWAHLGGFATGAALIPLMRRKGVVLLDHNMTEVERSDGAT